MVGPTHSTPFVVSGESAGREASELNELLCDECDGSGKLRNNKWKKGAYTFGFIECDECGGTGVATHNDRTQATAAAPEM